LALNNSKWDVSSRWSAALALGEIGSSNALPALTSCAQDKDAMNSWLISLCKNSIAIIKGEKPRAGKIYLYTIGVQKTRTDVEAGTTVVIP
jgi:HEAT repeat protein